MASLPAETARRADRIHPLVYLDYRIRIVACLLEALAISSVLWNARPAPIVWALLAAHAFVWPHVAFLNAKVGRNTKNAELTNLLIDAFLGGAWIVVVHFNPWPTVTVITALVVAFLSVAGIGFTLIAMGVQAAAIVLTGAVLGFEFDGAASPLTIAVSAGGWLFYATVFGLTTNRQARRIIQSNKTIENQKTALAESLEHQTATSEIARAISRSPGNAQPVLDAIAANVARLCDTVDSNVFVVDGDRMRRVAQFGTFPRREATATEGLPVVRQTVTGRAILERRAIHVADITAESAAAEYGESLRYQAATTVGSMLAVPVLLEGTSLGALLLRRPDVRPFSDRQVELVKTFADQAAIALDNARLFDELQARTRALGQSLEETRALSDVTRAMSSSLDLPYVFETVIRAATTVGGADAGAIFDVDAERRRYVAVAGHNVRPEFLAAIESRRVDMTTAAWRRTHDSRRPWQIADLAAGAQYDFHDLMLGEGFQAMLAAPIHAETALRGIVLWKRASGAFEPRAVDLLTALAEQAKVAIANAALFRAVEEKNRQVEAANRAKSQFLANMSHELRTPLNAILGYTELIIDETYGPVPEKIRDVLARVDASGKHLLGLINDVLDLSKIEAGQLRLALGDYSMKEVVHSVVVAVEALAAEKQLELTASVPGELPVGHGDERRLTQVVLNLVGNAIKFTSAGRIDVRVAASNGDFVVAVQDTGPGIPAADQARIFEEFQQLDGSDTRKQGGTGLGLAIARRIVEMHGGRLWVESAAGHGSTFSFAVPVRVAAPLEA